MKQLMEGPTSANSKPVNDVVFQKRYCLLAVQSLNTDAPATIRLLHDTWSKRYSLCLLHCWRVCLIRRDEQRRRARVPGMRQVLHTLVHGQPQHSIFMLKFGDGLRFAVMRKKQVQLGMSCSVRSSQWCDVRSTCSSNGCAHRALSNQSLH